MSQKQQERLEQQSNTEVSEVLEPDPIVTSSSVPTVDDVDGGDTQESVPSGDVNQPTGEAPQKRRKKRKTKWVSVDEVLPKPSYWPLALTLSLCVLLMGVMIHPIVIGVGAILVVISVIGWMLERR